MDLLKLTLEKNLELNLYCNVWIWATILFIVIIAIILTFIKKKTFFKKDVIIEEVELGIGNQKVKIKPNYQTKQVAYKLWVELNTRKLGLPIDLENDVISEIYDSWYDFFKIARELMKEIPAQKATDKETKILILLSSNILNKAVRPHLTKWQARYRGWYERKIETIKQNTTDISPQELQKQFKCSDKSDCYNSIIEDMIIVNKKLIYYKQKLEEIVFGEKLES
jgi:hypothetical protein